MALLFKPVCYLEKLTSPDQWVGAGRWTLHSWVISIYQCDVYWAQATNSGKTVASGSGLKVHHTLHFETLRASSLTDFCQTKGKRDLKKINCFWKQMY